MPELKSPLTVSIEITGRCNLDCIYCYKYPCPQIDMPKKHAYDLIEQFIELDIFRIEITGGEPFLHPNILDFIRIFSKNEKGPILAISSNGSVFKSRQFTLKFKKEIMNYIEKDKGAIPLQISLDSSYQEINDEIRGKTIDVIEGIYNLTDANIPLSIATVVHNHNISAVTSVIKKFYPKIKRYHFMNIMPSIKLLENKNYSLLRPKKSRLENAWKEIKSIRNKYPGIEVSIPFDKAENRTFKLTETIDCNRCVAGYTRITVTPDLKVIPCSLCRNIIMGDLQKNRFGKIWESKMAQNIQKSNKNPCLANYESL